MQKRLFEPELIDLGSAHYKEDEYRDCLYKLDRIGRFLGGDRATYKALDELPTPPSSILDVGCGGGLFTQRMAKRYSMATVTGVDISPAAIDFAQAHLLQNDPAPSNIQFHLLESPQLDLTNQFDVVLATLMCHHLSDEDLVNFIRQACCTAKKRVILNDLHRHPLAYASFMGIAPLFFRNRLIWHDGLLSIRRSFKKRDWKILLSAASIDENKYKITWHWAFRWIVTIDIDKTS